MAIAIGAQKDFLFKSYSCLKFFGKIFILKMVLFQKFTTTKNTKAREKTKTVLEMAWHVKQSWRAAFSLILTLMYLRITSVQWLQGVTW